jgi:hypothetical protein
MYGIRLNELLRISTFLYPIVGIVIQNQTERLFLQGAFIPNEAIGGCETHIICVHPFNPRHLRAKTRSKLNGTDALTALILAPSIFNSIQIVALQEKERLNLFNTKNTKNFRCGNCFRERKMLV